MTLKDFTITLEGGKDLQFKGFPSKFCGGPTGSDIVFVTIYSPTTQGQVDQVVVGGADSVRAELMQRLARPMGLSWKFTKPLEGAVSTRMDVSVNGKLIDLNISVAEVLTTGSTAFTTVPFATPNTQATADGLTDEERTTVEVYLSDHFPAGILVCWKFK